MTLFSKDGCVTSPECFHLWSLLIKKNRNKKLPLEFNQSRYCANQNLTLVLVGLSGIPLHFLLLLHVLFRLVLSYQERFPRVLSGSKITWHRPLAAYHSLYDPASSPTLTLSLPLFLFFGPTISS